MLSNMTNWIDVITFIRQKRAYYLFLSLSLNLSFRMLYTQQK